ncbi:MAG: hypothetical protein ACYC4S_10850 [Rhodoferax sp.]
MTARLNTIQFLTLRSIARGNWDFRLGMFEWRFNGKWSVLRRQHDRGLYDRAWDAAWELVRLGLVEMFTVRCCPGTSCHRNDRDEFRLTARGTALLQKANATSQQRNVAEHPAPEAPPVPVELLNSVSWWHKAASLLPWRRAS